MLLLVILPFRTWQIIILCSIGRYWKPFGVLDYFESRTDTMVTSLKNQLIHYQGCVFGANYAISLCGWNHVQLEALQPCHPCTSQCSTPRALDIMEAATTVKAITLVLFSVSVLSLAQGFSLTILHTNDNHARFEETNVRGFLCNPSDAQAGECYGGMARKATVIKKIRSETKNVLLISGGDVLTGTIWYRVYRGNATRYFMNELGYDIMVSKSSTSA